jgi:hypothetical protein
MEILSRDEFWGKCPAPGTKFVELDGGCSVVTANQIDPEQDEPDDITLIGFERGSSQDEDKVLVLSWGSWSDHPELLDQHAKAVESLKLEGYAHKCFLGIELTPISD